MPDPEPPLYDDAYPTCAETYATFRVFSDSVRPDAVSSVLGTQPTSSFQKGDVYGNGLHRKANGWFYKTRHLTSSRDNGRHVDLLLNLLESKSEALESLREQGCEIDIVSYGVSNAARVARSCGLSRCSSLDGSVFRSGGTSTSRGTMGRTLRRRRPANRMIGQRRPPVMIFPCR
jgi:hypothetical protein